MDQSRIRRPPLGAVLRDGRPVATQVGAVPADRLLAWVRETIASPA